MFTAGNSAAIFTNLSLQSYSGLITTLVLQLGELLGLLEDIVDSSLHVEGDLRQMIELS